MLALVRRTNAVSSSRLALTFNTIRHTRWSIVLIPCTRYWSHVSYAIHADFWQCLVQQLIIPELLNQIYIVAHLWKEEILSFPTMCHSSKFVTCIKFKGSSYDPSSTCERKSAVGINTISPISIDKSTLLRGLMMRLEFFAYSLQWTPYNTISFSN